MKLPGVARVLAFALCLALTPFARAEPATPPAAQPAPASPAKPKAKPPEPPAKVEGFAIPRDNGGFLGLQLVHNNFLLTFYDAKKHKIAPNVTRAALRWEVHYQPAPERAVLNPGGDAFSLTSAKVVRPPHDFKLFISLLVDGTEAAVEFYSIDFHD